MSDWTQLPEVQRMLDAVDDGQIEIEFFGIDEIEAKIAEEEQRARRLRGRMEVDRAVMDYVWGRRRG